MIFCAVLEFEVDVLSIFRKLETRDVTVEFLGEEPGFTTVKIDHRKMPGGVIAAQYIGSRNIGNALTIGMPCWRIFGARGSGQLNQVLTFIGIIRIHKPYAVIVVSIRLFGPIADKGDGFSIGRPRGTGIVIIAGGDLGKSFRFDVIYVNVIASPIEITGVILLELDAVDHPGFSLYPFFFGVLCRGRDL